MDNRELSQTDKIVQTVLLYLGFALLACALGIGLVDLLT